METIIDSLFIMVGISFIFCVGCLFDRFGKRYEE